jgi:hypothetical protein
MNVLAIVGIGIYLIGHGTRGIPNTGVIGSVAMIVGGALVLLSALI